MGARPGTNKTSLVKIFWNKTVGKAMENNDSNMNKVENNLEYKIMTSENRTIQDLNYRPIIGILAQELDDSLEPWFGDNYTSYISASYVKFIEQAGARVVPVLINQNEEYYDKIFRSTNGLLIPGGDADLSDSGKSFIFTPHSSG